VLVDDRIDAELLEERDPAFDVAVVNFDEQRIVVVVTNELVAAVRPDGRSVDLCVRELHPDEV